MTASRESIYTALFNLVSASASFKTSSRRLKLWSDVNAADKPAVFVAQRGEKYVQGSDATPQKVTLKADIFIYTNAGKDPNVIPATILNNLVDAVNAAIAESPVTGRQTLGGLVSHCWIEGDAMIDPGDIDGDGVAILPVRILIP
jgi:hypothetical protein